MTISFDLTGKNVLVTGASSGIGRAIAIAAAEKGAFVILSARNQERLEETAKLCGPNAVCEPFDLGNIQELDRVPKFVQSVVKKHGVLSGLVHSAGIAVTVPLSGVRSSSVIETFVINSASALMLSKGISRLGNFNAEGTSVVFISSVAAHCGTTGLASYTMSKGAVESLARTLAIELKDSKIRFNSVAPAMIETPMFEDFSTLTEVSPEAVDIVRSKHPGGFGKPEDVAAAVIYLLSDAGRYVNGTSLFVDGGYCAQ